MYTDHRQADPVTATPHSPDPSEAPDSTDTPAETAASDDAETTETPDRVAAAATSAGMLSLGSTSVLGTMTSDSAPRALVRLRGGRVQMVRPGDQLDRAVVQAITPGVIHLLRNGAAQQLTMPGTG